MAVRENLPIPADPDFSAEIGGLNQDDPVHYAQMNAILTRLLTNDVFLEKLASKMVEKTLIAHVLDSTNTSMVLGADQAPALTALLDTERERITKLNSDLTVLNTKITNNGIVDSYSGDAVINLDWVRAGTVVYKVLNGTCFVDFDITVKAITAVNTLIVSGLPTSTIVRHGRIAGWENGNISMPFYLNNTDIIANPCSAGRYAGCFSFSII